MPHVSVDDAKHMVKTEESQHEGRRQWHANNLIVVNTVFLEHFGAKQLGSSAY